MKRLLVGLILIVCVGCGPKYSPDFIRLTREHKIATKETSTALISAIEDDMQNELDVDEVALSELKDRLAFISAQAEAIHKFVMKEITEEELAKYFAAVWRNNR